MNYQNKRRPHAELIHAWADGKTIQIRLKESQEKWKDLPDSGLPLFNDKHFEYRISPEGNERSKPKFGEEYYFIDDECDVLRGVWLDETVDNKRCSVGNCFHTKKLAEAAIPRVESALKGDFATGNNVGSKSEIDGKPLTDGEKALIRAMRLANVSDVHGRGSILVVMDANGLRALYRTVAFSTAGNSALDETIRAALKQIQAEQVEGR